MPVHEPAPCPARLLRVVGEVVVHVRGAPETQARVDELARLVKSRCPVANTLHAAGTEFEVRWRCAESETANVL